MVVGLILYVRGFGIICAIFKNPQSKESIALGATESMHTPAEIRSLLANSCTISPPAE